MNLKLNIKLIVVVVLIVLVKCVVVVYVCSSVVRVSYAYPEGRCSLRCASTEGLRPFKPREHPHTPASAEASADVRGGCRGEGPKARFPPHIGP